jgi:3-oxoacyl-(acyl-carrier-protein) synthase
MDVQDVCSLLFPACLAALQVIAGLSNSFGFGGHNSAVVFAPFEA